MLFSFSALIKLDICGNLRQLFSSMRTVLLVVTELITVVKLFIVQAPELITIHRMPNDTVENLSRHFKF
jgi:hypothetical protein